MKNHELIEKVGGIEKAQEIVAGAPDGATDYWGSTKGEYAKKSNIIHAMTPWGDMGGSRTDVYKDGAWFVCRSSGYPILINLDAIRTAIAEHDAPKFKVGDAIVYVDSFMHDEIGIVSKVGDRVWFNRGAAVCELDMVRHATQSEIQSGHRELLGNSEQLDDVADIKYHVSPSCVVVNHD